MTFDIDALQAEARERSGGLADFGDPAFRPALAALLRALDHETHLSDTGRRLLGGRIVELLRNRLVLEEGLSFREAREAEEPLGAVDAAPQLRLAVGPFPPSPPPQPGKPSSLWPGIRTSLPAWR